MIGIVLDFFKKKFIYADIEKLKVDWEVFKTLIKRSINESKFDEAIRLLEGLGTFGWKYNFLSSFSDPEVESLLFDLVNKLNIETPNFEINRQRVVFYDFFCLENRGFTQQYLDVIIKNGFELFYIATNESLANENNGIIKLIRKYDKGKLFVIPGNITPTSKLEMVVKQITEYGPSKIFFHSAPWDILSCLIGIQFKEANTKTYLLNITDHAYWPGNSVFDYFIDFREYGSSVNKYQRKIDEEKILLIPTPPYLQSIEDFDGFPVEVHGKVVGFAGGTIYKIIDQNNTFLSLIKELLHQNSDFIFFFANVGGEDYLRKFIFENNLEQRFFLIGNRRDINEVFKRIDIFFNTFPYGGGLMLQYAIANKKPVVALWDERLIYTRIDKVIDKYLPDEYLISTPEKYIEIANKLIKQQSFRSSFALGLMENMDVEVIFVEKLTKLLNDNLSNHIVKLERIKVNSEAITEFHINIDNSFSSEYVPLKDRYLQNAGIKYKIMNIQIPKLLLKITNGMKKIKV